jgi:hypothetical protein
MAVNVTDRANAGTAYASALSTFISAYVELAATERALLRYGTNPPGGQFGAELGDIDLTLLRHPLYAPAPDQPRLVDRVAARAAQL